MKDSPKKIKKKAEKVKKSITESKTDSTKTAVNNSSISFLRQLGSILSFKQHKKQNHGINILIILPVVSLFIVLLVLTVYNAAIKKQIEENRILPEVPVQVSKYPFIKRNYGIDITAESAIIIDDTSKVTLFEKNPLLRFSMASTTKIMTAIVALEYFKEDDIITINSMYEEGVVIGFPVGTKVRFKDMLFALLLPSANDAAYAIADNYPGGINGFVTRMNEKAAEINMNFTHYSDPAGLEDDGDYTTVTDLAKLASYALKNREFAAIVATKKKVISTVDTTNIYTLINLNKLLGENGVIGVKTGYTEGAGEVLVISKIEKEHMYIVIVMKSLDRFGDTTKLLNLISDNISFIDPADYLLDKKSN